MVRVLFSFFGAIFSWLTLAGIAAALVVLGIFSLYGRDLPSHESLAQYTPPTISRIYSGQGDIIDEFARERRLFAPSEEIPDLVKQAFISAEDKNFYEHSGYDTRGMVAAARDAVVSRGRDLRGASTITQQVMKNFLLSGDRTAERKIKELILASRIEGTLDKEQILELYLNEIFLGQNSYGVAAAAQTYFNKGLSALNAEEAAYLAVLPKAPSRYHPVRQQQRAIERRNFVLKEMFENGYLDEAAYQTSRAAPLKTVQSGDFEPFRAQLPPRGYFTDEIRRQLSRDFGEEEFFSGGYAVRATVDAELQIEAAAALRRGLETYDRNQGLWRPTGLSIDTASLEGEAWREALSELRIARDIDLNGPWLPAVVLSTNGNAAQLGIEGREDLAEIEARDVTWARRINADDTRGSQAKVPGDLVRPGEVVHVRAITRDSDGSFVRWSLRQVPEVQGGFMAMDVNSGRVLAMQGGFSYQHSVFNRATQALRQPGSAFKPFVYAAALDSGYTPATIVIDAPIEIDTPDGLWRPKNASNRFYGPTPLRTGIEQSRNLMTIRLAEEVGMRTVASYAERFGVYEEMGPFLANALGSEETTLFNVVAAYAMFANGGERVLPTLVDRVQDRYGKTVFKHDQRRCDDCDLASLDPGLAPQVLSDRRRVINDITAYQLTSMLEGVVLRGTANSTVKLGVPVAGKTGTTNDAKDAWFVGFTSNIVAGCYVGFDQPRSLGRKASGGGLCGPVFTEFMQNATAKYGGGAFEAPDECQFIKIDRFTGARLLEEAFGADVVAECFRLGEEPIFGLTFDGGFAMGADLPMFDRGVEEVVKEVTTSSGSTGRVGNKASFGSLSSGGLY